MRRVAAFIAALFLTPAAALASTGSLTERAHAAIVSAVRDRIGPRAEVRVESLRVTGELEGPIVARPAPGGRTGSRIRFVLSPADGQPRSGDADAIISVSVPHLKASRTIRRGELVGADAVVEDSSELSGLLLQPFPGRDAFVGATAVRDVASGEAITPSVVTPSLMVKSGDKVLVRAAIDGLEVQATLVAAQAGRLGDRIRCVNPDTRRSMTVRITGRGQAEIINGF
jgi:flagella basal body P-ring formation protein FlgA